MFQCHTIVEEPVFVCMFHVHCKSGSTSSPSLCVGQIPIKWSDEEKKSVDVFVSGGRFLRTLQRCPK